MLEIDPLRNSAATYLQVADAIAARIADGVYTSKLPTERALAQEFGVAYQTLRHSMDVLRTHALIITRQGRGTFVAASVLAAELD
jgi:DNA-binding GntR family transcriptional regulator